MGLFASLRLLRYSHSLHSSFRSSSPFVFDSFVFSTRSFTHFVRKMSFDQIFDEFINTEFAGESQDPCDLFDKLFEKELGSTSLLSDPPHSTNILLTKTLKTKKSDKKIKKHVIPRKILPRENDFVKKQIQINMDQTKLIDDCFIFMESQTKYIEKLTKELNELKEKNQ